MSSRFASHRHFKPLIYTSAFAAAGGSYLYISYRPRDIPGSDQAPARPLNVTKDGVIIPPRFPAIKTRDRQIADLKRSGAPTEQSQIANPRNNATSSQDVYDLLVTGEGAPGTGIALDAATRGLKVALVERDDFSSGTSSKSTKLVHGG